MSKGRHTPSTLRRPFLSARRRRLGLPHASASFGQPALALARTLTLTLTLTLTQVASLSPSTGAVPGGTLVTVNGTAFDAGGAYRCGFGAAGVAEATRVDDAI